MLTDWPPGPDERENRSSNPAAVTVRTPSSGAACGARLLADRRYLLVGAREGQVVEVNSCGGTRAARDRVLTQVSALLVRAARRPR